MAAKMAEIVGINVYWLYMMAGVSCHPEGEFKPLLLAPAVTVGETEGAMDSASVFF